MKQENLEKPLTEESNLSRKEKRKKRLEERFFKAWGRKPKGRIIVSSKKKERDKKFILTDKVKKEYEELTKLHHIENPFTDECPYF